MSRNLKIKIIPKNKKTAYKVTKLVLKPEFRCSQFQERNRNITRSAEIMCGIIFGIKIEYYVSSVTEPNMESGFRHVQSLTGIGTGV